MKDKKRRNSNNCKECNNYRLSHQNKHMRRGNKHEKKTTILSIFLAAFMALLLNVGNVKAAPTGQDIVNYAMKFRGTPYVWGGKDPSGFDCSGLVYYVYKNAAGIELPGNTYGQITKGTPVSQSNLQPGDLVFTDNVEHVGIYVGNGQMIHAPQSGDVVKVSDIWNFYAGRRIINTPQSYVKVDGGDILIIMALQD